MENENSIIDISNVSEEIVSENDLPCLLENYESQALRLLENFEFAEALGHFRRVEDIIESISTQGGMMNSEYIVSTLHNIAYCYQQ